eukprot:CAMPEP_0194041576 /NCGR_PEP_ID=MMETSP0009_2-20130614/13467_1 /TAXON_ID=210454 /ORGANISM="Grammatophora oceanica, Strain CCMP 410" /LENGTH=637 /DNA_ID=CAMNT_0038685133 /DNA_START=203 /DNA_END=2116 /DNA_ORIENTATION=+
MPPHQQSGFRRQAPTAIETDGGGGVDDEYNYGVAPEEDAEGVYQDSRYHYDEEADENVPPPPEEDEEQLDGDEALLDLAQLEELHAEAERMKALGNKHMAAQEYTRAYNAYSAALQLSPVGPSSHVFLSNRAAALLSMKQYKAAATDAQRAVALGPTFGKAHARLGQSLYFLKDYEGAVTAYEDSIRFEPDNEVTKTYLEKARTKLAKRREKEARVAARTSGTNNNNQQFDEHVSMAEETASIQPTVANSIATDPNRSAAMVQQVRRTNTRQQAAVAPPKEVQTGQLSQPTTPLTPTTPSASTFGLLDEEDPDFEEALRIQQRAHHYLMTKQYRKAIEEFTAALFLVPDDPNLSPELHLGRAHALNGSRRHESARIDAQLAVKKDPSPEAYSTLAKSEFYLKDFGAAIEAFEECMRLLPDGEELSAFDQAYLRKAEVAFHDEMARAEDDQSIASLRSMRSTKSAKSIVPKLPPPRFVPREEAIVATPNMPKMPKSWPMQTPRTPTGLLVGRERPVTFYSEMLGVKLNRGPDGVVRVLTVAPDTPGSPIVRNGSLTVGDVVREAAGVDLRRPITNIMWGDTVALIKMAPRPITLVLAEELSEEPIEVKVERERNAKIITMSPAALSIAEGEEKEEEEV